MHHGARTEVKTKSPGKELEGLVKFILQKLEPRCKFWKLPTDLQLARKGDAMILAHRDPMPADFMGWGPNGKTVLIECKDTDANRLKLGGSPGLSPFQWQCAKMAGLSGSVRYFVVWKRMEEFAIISAHLVSGVKSIRWVDLMSFNMVHLEDHLRAAILYV